MKKIIMACISIALLVALPLTSLAAPPRPLVPENRRVAPTIPRVDPDGPYVGGLDDPTDWIYLASFIGNVFIIPAYLLGLSYIISEQQGLISLIWNVMVLWWCVRYGVINGFFEAFDLRDIDEDGN